MQDLNERDKTYLQHILTDVLKTGKHFQITLTTLSDFPICLYGFAVGRGYLLFSYPLSEKLEELDAERELNKITQKNYKQLKHIVVLFHILFGAEIHNKISFSRMKLIRNCLMGKIRKYFIRQRLRFCKICHAA